MQNPLPLPQLTALLTLLNQALDIIDISRWTGDPHNGAFISGQLRLLADTIEEAQQTLKGGEDVAGGKWWEDAMTEDVCHPVSSSHSSFNHIVKLRCTPMSTGLVALPYALLKDPFTYTSNLPRHSRPQ